MFFHSFLYLLIPLLCGGMEYYLRSGMEDNKKINGTWLPSDNLYFNKGDKMIKSNPKCGPDGWIQTIPDFMGSRRLRCLTFITGVGTRYSRAQSSMKVRINKMLLLLFLPPSPPPFSFSFSSSSFFQWPFRPSVWSYRIRIKEPMRFSISPN